MNNNHHCRVFSYEKSIIDKTFLLLKRLFFKTRIQHKSHSYKNTIKNYSLFFKI